jgi:hypothetical protein
MIKPTPNPPGNRRRDIPLRFPRFNQTPMAIYQMSEMGLLLAEKALDQERAIAVA